MNGRFLRSRSVRKFLRSHLAVAAIIVIAAYFAMAALVALFGIVTLDDTTVPVGPRSLPGFFRTQSAEKRLEAASNDLEAVERALKKKNPKPYLAEIAFAERHVALKTVEELRQIVNEGLDLYEELADSENLNEEPELLPEVEELEHLAAQLFAPLSGYHGFVYKLRLLLGTDRQGRSISVRAVYSIKVAIQVGLVTALFSVILGGLLGAIAAFYGGWVDHLIIWLYSTFMSIPNLVLLTVLVYMFTGSIFERTLIPVYVAFCMTFWVGPCRVIRGETLKIKELEYVQAATAVGFGRFYILLRHVIPNTAHLIFINFSLLFIGAIKSEVILSFLGLGVKEGPSWGIMISHSKHEVVNGFFWQIASATAFMFVLVLAFNIVSDALQDAFDPKHV